MKSIYIYEVNTTFSKSNFQSDIDKKLEGVGLGFIPSFFTRLNCKSNGPTSGQRRKRKPVFVASIKITRVWKWWLKV